MGNQEIEADHILSQKNWTNFSFLELAQAGRVTPAVAKELATNYLNKKYENLEFDIDAYFEEKDKLIEILKRKIAEKNNG